MSLAICVSKDILTYLDHKWYGSTLYPFKFDLEFT